MRYHGTKSVIKNCILSENVLFVFNLTKSFMQFCVTSKDFCLLLLDLKSTFNDGKSHLLFFKANFLINLAFNFCYHQVQNLISLDRDMILTSGFGSAKETAVLTQY